MILLVADLAQAKVKNETLTPQQFVQVVREHLAQVSTDYPNTFNGDLDDIGGECIVSLDFSVPQKLGLARLVMKSDKGFEIDAVIFIDDKVKVKKYEIEDGSYEKTYVFGIGGVHKLVINHNDDASDSMTLETGITRLGCGVYY